MEINEIHQEFTVTMQQKVDPNARFGVSLNKEIIQAETFQFKSTKSAEGQQTLNPELRGKHRRHTERDEQRKCRPPRIITVTENHKFLPFVKMSNAFISFSQKVLQSKPAPLFALPDCEHLLMSFQDGRMYPKLQPTNEILQSVWFKVIIKKTRKS